jgi:LuxR family maltose regulon positive regulatory protein
MALYEAMATWDVERLSALHQEMQELGQDEEVIWQVLPLLSSFVLHYSMRQEGTVLLPRLREAKQRVSQSGSHFAIIRVMSWLAMAEVQAGQLLLAYQEGLAALELIEQIKGYTLLKGFFELDLAWVLYQWNRLEEACGRLQTLIEDATIWQHSDLLLSGYLTLMQVELAIGDLPAVQQALQAFEQLEAHQGYAYHWRWLPLRRVQWWLAQGQVKEASGWATSVIFPQGAWDGFLYDAFPTVIRVYFAQRRWTETLDLLEQWSGHLDRPANIEITITYLAQLLVALHQTGKNEQANEIAARLFALTEPEGYLRMYLDEGEPMRQALLAWLTSHPRQHQQPSSTTVYVSRLLAAFEQEANGASEPLAAAKVPEPSFVQQPSSVPAALMASLTQREQEVLRLLATGASNQEIADALVISIATVKKHVSNLLGKLGVSSRTQAIARARTLSLL